MEQRTLVLVNASDPSTDKLTGTGETVHLSDQTGKTAAGVPNITYFTHAPCLKATGIVYSVLSYSLLYEIYPRCGIAKACFQRVRKCKRTSSRTHGI